jgi:acyl-CoA synthetase (AMP-forming)/AMP-acid ligase II/thioesterase domain-containing protein
VRSERPSVAANLESPPTVCALLARNAESIGERDFLVCAVNDERISYAEINRRVSYVAANLAAAGLAPGDKVATLLSNSTAAVEIALGAMAAGLVPVPLNPIGGSRYIESVLGHCDARLLVVTPETRKSIEEEVARASPAITVVDADAARAHGNESCTQIPVGADDDALLIYTSGTTGRPRGALFTQAQVLQCAANVARALELDATDRLLCVLPLYHLNAFEKLLTVCLTGGTIVLADQFRTDRFWHLLTAHRCTWVMLVPTIVRQLLRHADRVPPPSPPELAHLRFARSSSAPLPTADHLAFEERFGVVLAEGMGMTEAGTLFHNPPTRDRRIVGSLGLPCGVEIKLVDAGGAALGCDQIGEIVVRGPGLMKGYYKDPKATAAVLDSDGWLRSGDRASRNAAGYYFHAGRIKEIIIKGGVNIAPVEVDSVAAAHPDVVAAAACAIPDAYFGENVGLFVVKRTGSVLTEAEVQEFCEQHLGLFKSPARVAFVDKIPKDAFGKLQRYKLAGDLPPATVPIPAVVADRRASRTATEDVLCALWSEFLQTQCDDVHVDFSSLGGSSLLALQIAARIRAQLGVDLPLASFFEAPTIAQHAAIVDSGQRRRPTAANSLPILLSPTVPNCGVPPLFCAYGPNKYRRLAKQLGASQPVYGLYDALEPSLLREDLVDAEGTPATTVEDLARRYVAQMRAIQPRGPFHLAGFSFGGLVAFEMAQQLRREGEAVDLVAVIDTYAPGSLRFRAWRWFTHHLRQSLKHGPSYILQSMRNRLRRRGIEMPQPGEALDDTDLLARAWRFRQQARRSYVARPYPGKIVLVRATVQPGPAYDLDPFLGWQPLALGGLEVHDNPCDHHASISSANVRVVAEALRPHLAAGAAKQPA